MLEKNGCSRINGRCAEINDKGFLIDFLENLPAESTRLRIQGLSALVIYGMGIR